jgi:quercetin dioxygenase-like cupin family protein
MEKRAAQPRPRSGRPAGGRSVVRWTDVPEEHVSPLVRRRVIRGDRVETVRYAYRPGASFPLHAHPQEQWIFVLRGSVTLRVGGTRLVAVPGEAVRIAGGVPHGLASVGRRGAVTLNVFSPPRKELPGAR